MKSQAILLSLLFVFAGSAVALAADRSENIQIPILKNTQIASRLKALYEANVKDYTWVGFKSSVFAENSGRAWLIIAVSYIDSTPEKKAMETEAKINFERQQDEWTVTRIEIPGRNFAKTVNAQLNLK